MTKITTKNIINAKANAIAKARKDLEKMEAEYAEMRLEALRSVEMIKGENTVTLLHGNDVYKCVFNPRYRRYSIKKNGVMIDKESLWGIHDIRFQIAMGTI